MLDEFPQCPICKSNEGYFVEGTLIKTVKCNNCGAKFHSPQFVSLATMKELQLRDLPRDGRCAGLRRKYQSVDFWKRFNIEDSVSMVIDVEFEEAKAKGEIIFDKDWSEEELYMEIKKDMSRLAHYGKQAGMKLRSRDLISDIFVILGSKESERRTMWGQIAVILTNSIQIRQNELILRKLQNLIDITEQKK